MNKKGLKLSNRVVLISGDNFLTQATSNPLLVSLNYGSETVHWNEIIHHIFFLIISKRKIMIIVIKGLLDTNKDSIF